MNIAIFGVTCFAVGLVLGFVLGRLPPGGSFDFDGWWP